MPGSAPPPSPARQDPALPAETAAAQRRRPGAVTGTGTARHCPSGTTGGLDGPDGPWCLPPACLLPPGPGASPGAAADRGRYRRSQPGGLMPADAIGLGLRQRPGIPRRVSWVTYHCCTRPSPSLKTSRQALRSWCQPGLSGEHHAAGGEVPSHEPSGPGAGDTEATCAVPGSRATHRAPGTLTSCWPGR